MFKGQHIAITGASGGIGRAIAQAGLARGAKVSISDVNAAAVRETANALQTPGYVCDVSDEAAVKTFIKNAQETHGPIDTYVSNAGIGLLDLPGKHAAGGSNESWEKSWQINTMANVYAARALIPDWKARGKGRFVVTASAAGLLAQIGTASYTVSKHAAVAFAEYMAIMHKGDGIAVHCICPQYVKTNMTKGMTDVKEGPEKHLEPSDVADALFAAIGENRFLVLPHAVVQDYWSAKVADYDRYISGMAKRKEILFSTPGSMPGLMED